MVDVYISIGQAANRVQARRKFPLASAGNSRNEGPLRVPLPHPFSLLLFLLSFFPFSPSPSKNLSIIIRRGCISLTKRESVWRKTKERKGVKFDRCRGVLLYFWKRLFQSMNILKANKAERAAPLVISLPHQRTQQRSSRLLNRPANAFLSTLS